MRKPIYQIQTYFDEDTQLYIKQATKLSRKHLMDMLDAYTYLRDRYAKYPDIHISPPERLDDTHIWFAPASGLSLDEHISQHLLSEADALEKAMYLIEILTSKQSTQNKPDSSEQTWLVSSDIILSNIFLDPDTKITTLIDYERSSQLPANSPYLTYRLLRDHAMRASQYIENSQVTPHDKLFSLCDQYQIWFWEAYGHELQEIRFLSSVDDDQHWLPRHMWGFVFRYIRYRLWV